MTAPANLRPPSRPVTVGELLLPTVLHLTTRGPQSAANFSTLLASAPGAAGQLASDPVSPAEPPDADGSGPTNPKQASPRAARRLGTRVTASAAPKAVTP